MAQQIINVGTSPNDGQGDSIRLSFTKTNTNFTELYGRTTPANMVNGTTSILLSNSGPANINIAGTSNIAVFTVGGLAVDGNITGSYILGNGYYLTGIAGGGGYGNVNVATFLSDFGSNTVSTTGNVTAGFFYGDGSALTGLPALYGNSNVAAYLPTYTGNISGGNISTTGNITAQGVVSATGNIVTTGYFVGTFMGNVTGNFVVPGSNTQVIFNTSGNADAVGGLTYNKDSNVLTVLGVVSAQGNIIGGNIVTGALVSATGNITSAANVTGANLLTGGLISATANITGGNINTGGLVSATANVRGGNILTGGLISATANITGGNLLTGGLISATANITGGNILTGGTMSVSGNITGGNVLGGANVNATTHTGSTVSVTGAITGGSLNTGGAVSATGSVTGSAISASGNITGGNILFGTGQISGIGNIYGSEVSVTGNISAAGFLGGASGFSVAGNITGGNILTSGLVSASGNITGNYYIGNGSALTGIDATSIQFGNSNVRVVSSGGDVAVGIGGTSNIAVFSSTGEYVTGLISASGNISAANITGGNLLTSGLISVTGAITVNSGNAATAIVNGAANGVGNIGSASGYFNTVFAQATSAQYADLAECYLADANYEPGTVVIFGGDHEVTISTSSGDPTVAGVVSTRPAYQMNSGLQGEHVVSVALTGRVPCKVIGPVTKGAMMISADNGYAQAQQHPEIGTVIGKAIQAFDGEQGIIEVVVGRL